VIPLGLLIAQLLFGSIRVDADVVAAPIVHRVHTPTGPYAEAVLTRYLDQIAVSLHDAGFWYPSVELVSVFVDTVSSRIHIDLRVGAGDPVRMTHITLDGAKRFTYDRIRSRIPDRSGALATRSAREALRQDLLVSGFYQSVEQTDPIHRDGVDVVPFQVRDIAPGRIDGLLGWSEGDWVGTLDLGLRHAFGLGHLLTVRLDRMRRLETDLNVRSAWDRISDSPYSVEFEGTLIQQDSTYLVMAAGITGEVATSGGDRYGIWLEQRQVMYPDLVRGGYAMVGVRTVGGRLSDPFFPTQGSRYRMSAGSGTREDGSRVNRVSGDWLGILHSNGRTAWVGMGATGFMDSDSIRADERFRIGGASSFRGVPEAGIRSSRYIWTEIEGRYLLDQETFAFAFSGFAAATGRRPILNVGAGFSYVTRAGTFQITAASTSADWTRPVLHVRLSSGP
jgi:outer membrane protein assembly factor BamA